MTNRQGQTPKKPEQVRLACTLKQDQTVEMRDGGGRRGRIVCKPENGEYDWLVAWENTNLRTCERERDLKIWNEPAAEPVTRRGPTRAAVSIREHRPAHQMVMTRAAIAAGGKGHAG